MTADARPAAPFSAWERSIALRYLKARRKTGGVALVSIIAFIGIAAAVAVLISVMSIMNGFRSELLDRMLGFNGHLTVTGQVLDEPERDLVLKRIRAIPGVAQAVPMVQSEALVQGRGEEAGAVIRGVSPEDLRDTRIIASNIKSGSLNGYGQGEDGGDLILVGDRLAADMGVDAGDALTLTSPSGQATVLGSEPVSKAYTVGGTFSVGMSDFDENFIYMPLAQAQMLFNRGTSADLIEIMLDDPDDVARIKPLVQQAVGPGGVVSDWQERNQAYFNALEVERFAMRMILYLIVLIAGVNIVSGLIMLVKNKGKDIAILRTMGATRSAILRIFFMIGAIISASGTAAGIVIAVLFCTYIQPIQAFVEWVSGTQVFNAKIYFLSHIPAKLDWSEVAWVSVLSLSVALAATLLPALQASRIDPVEALRYE